MSTHTQQTKKRRPHLFICMKYQINKVHNLKLAARTINKVIIEPNETFSFWQLVRWADHHEKYKDELNLVKQVFIELQLKGSNSV